MKKELNKLIFTERDFENMGWHDNRIYAIAFGLNEHEIMLDIDYIIQWQQNGSHFEFMVAPATLVFRNVYDLNINLSVVNAVIDGVYRNNPVKPKNFEYINEQLEYDWTIEANNGEINFKSVGFTQYLRRKPTLGSREIGLLKRGGICFDTDVENLI